MNVVFPLVTFKVRIDWFLSHRFFLRCATVSNEAKRSSSQQTSYEDVVEDIK